MRFLEDLEVVPVEATLLNFYFWDLKVNSSSESSSDEEFYNYS